MKKTLALLVLSVWMSLPSFAQASPDPILECRGNGALEGITKITIRPTDLVGQMLVVSETENTKDALGQVVPAHYSNTNGDLSDERIFIKRVSRSVLGHADLILVRGLDAQGKTAYRLEAWFTCSSEDPDLCVMSRGMTTFEKSASLSCQINSNYSSR